VMSVRRDDNYSEKYGHLIQLYNAIMDSTRTYQDLYNKNIFLENFCRKNKTCINRRILHCSI